MDCVVHDYWKRMYILYFEEHLKTKSQITLESNGTNYMTIMAEILEISKREDDVRTI